MRHLLFIFICSLSLSPFSQTKLTEKQEAAILETCNVYLEEQMRCYSDSTHADQLFKSVTSDTLYQLMSMNREYYSLMGYNIKYAESKANSILNNDTSLACKVDDGEFSFTLDVKEKGEKWIVYGYGNYQLSGADLIERRNRLDTARIHSKQILTVKQICTDFVTYWNELEKKGLSKSLQNITSEYCYKTLALRKQIDTLDGWHRGKNYKLYEIEDPEFIDEETADVRIRMNEGSTRLRLSKANGKWLVMGENGKIRTAEDVARLQLKVEQYEERKKVANAIAWLNDAFDSFIIHNYSDVLEEVTTAEVYQYLTFFKEKCGAFEQKRLKMYGIGSLKYGLPITIYGDTAVCKSTPMELTMVYQNEKWILCGLDGVMGSQLDHWHMERNYQRIYDEFRLNYSNYASYEGPAEDVMSVLEDEEKEDTSVYSQLYQLRNPAQFEGGIEERIAYLQSKNDSGSGEPTLCFVTFIIEKNGTLTGIQVLTKGLSLSQIEKATRIIKEMPNWQPAHAADKFYRSRQVIGIEV